MRQLYSHSAYIQGNIKGISASNSSYEVKGTKQGGSASVCFKLVYNFNWQR